MVAVTVLGTVALTRVGLLLWSTLATGTGEGDGEWEGGGGMAEEGEHMGEVGRDWLTAWEVDGIWSFRQPPLSKAGGQRPQSERGHAAKLTRALRTDDTCRLTAVGEVLVLLLDRTLHSVLKRRNKVLQREWESSSSGSRIQRNFYKTAFRILNFTSVFSFP